MQISFKNMNQPIIEVTNLSKKYRLGQRRRQDTLRDELASMAKTGIKIFQGKKDNHLEQDEFWALENVNFCVNRGEAIGIIGRNGSGKSTLLKILSRITYPTVGEVKISGRIASLLEVGTGFSAELSGLENIFLNGAILGMTQKEIKAKFDAIVDFSGVEKFIDTPVKHYSSGMYMRLAFAVAAHLTADILLVDEVLAVGDAEFQRKCLGKMEDVIKKQGRTILFVSHNLAAIQNLCGRCLFLKNGRLEEYSKTREVISRYLSSTTLLLNQGLETRLDRQGNGHVRITRVDFYQNGRQINDLMMGIDTTIKVSYKTISELAHSLNFVLAINEGTSQNRLLQLSSAAIGKEIRPDKKNGEKQIEILFKKTPLPPGDYNYNVWFDCRGEIVDWVIDAGRFNVSGEIVAEYEIR